jgi:cytochrome c553
MRQRSSLPLPAFLALGAFIATLATTLACQSKPPAPAPGAPDYAVTATIKDLMLGVIDPAADVVWLAVSFVNGDKGIVETRPRNDMEWAAIRRGAVALAESTNLLQMPGRRVAAPGEKSETPGIELEPEEMDALIAKEPAAWNRHAKDLYTATMLALAAIDAKDSDKLFEVGETIEAACEACHKSYWYPNEKIPEFPASIPEPPATTGKP